MEFTKNILIKKPITQVWEVLELKKTPEVPGLKISGETLEVSGIGKFGIKGVEKDAGMISYIPRSPEKLVGKGVLQVQTLPHEDETKMKITLKLKLSFLEKLAISALGDPEKKFEEACRKLQEVLEA